MDQNRNAENLIAAFVVSVVVAPVCWSVAAHVAPDLVAYDPVRLMTDMWMFRATLPRFFERLAQGLLANNFEWIFLVVAFVSTAVFGLLTTLIRGSTRGLTNGLALCAFGAAAAWAARKIFILQPGADLLIMPVTAWVLGGVATALSYTPAADYQLTRGARIAQAARRTSEKIVKRSIAAGQISLANEIVPPPAEPRHFLIMGVTGAGKSTAINAMMAGAFARGDRAIIADPDGTALSQFWQPGDSILNPFDSRSVTWDLLSEIMEPADCALIAEALIPVRDAGESAVWTGYAQEIFQAALETWWQHDLGPSEEFVKTISTASPEKLGLLCEGKAAHRFFEAGAEKMLAGSLGTFARELKRLSYLPVTNGGKFCIREWVHSGHGRLWLTYEAKKIPALRELIGLWLALGIFEMLALEDDLRRRVWVFVDELDALGKIHALRDAMTRVRKKGGCLVLGLQSYSQVQQAYGDTEARTIIENCGNRLILRCQTSDMHSTAALASTMIGDREIDRTEVSTSLTRGAHATAGRTVTTHRKFEAAVLPSEITALPDGSGYLKFSGQPTWKKICFGHVDFPVVTSKIETAPLKA